MDINALVESITAPFLEEDEYSEPLDSTSTDNKDNYPLGRKLNESDVLKKLLSVSSVPAIQKLSGVLDEPSITSFLDASPEASSFVSNNIDDAQSDSWASKNQDMADKIGYEVVDYIDGTSGNEEVSVTLDDDTTFMDTSGQICEEFSYRQKIRDLVSKNLKKKRLCEFISRNESKIKKILSESNATGLVNGGTTELSPFASVEGYYKFSKLRSENSGYTYLMDYFEPEFVYGNVGEDNGSFSIIEEDAKRLIQTYNEIDKLYLEYVLHTTSGFSDHITPNDGSDYDTQSGNMGDGSHIDPSKVAVHTPFKNPPGNGGLSRAKQLTNSNIKEVNNTPKNKMINGD